MKRIVFVFVLFGVVLSAASARTFAVPTAQQVSSSLPWYFPEGIITTQDPLKQRIEYERYFIATEPCLQGTGLQALIVDKDSIRIKTNIKSTSSITDPNANMEIVLDDYRKIGGQVRVTTFCGQRLISEQQSNVVAADMIATATQAADIAFEKHKDVQSGAIKSLARQFGESVDDLKKRLGEKDPISGITFSDLYRIPKDMKRSDFFPRELHLGYTPTAPGILGLALLNTGLVYYNPQARILDFLMGAPVILAHEFIHTNSNLQKFPFADGFNAELYASLPMLAPEDKVNFFFHGYPVAWRQIAWVFFGFDFTRVRKEIFRLELAGNLTIDEEKYRAYFQMLEQIKKEISDFSPLALEAYYSNQLWWSAFNERLRDPDIVFKMMMALNYDPTLLGGRENTMKWYSVNKPLVDEISKSALASLDTSSAGDPNETVRIPVFALRLYQSMFAERERKNIEKYYAKNPGALRAIRASKFEDAFLLLKKIGETGGVQ